MSNIKALTPTGQKLLARVKFKRGGQNYKMTMTDRPNDPRSQGHKNGNVYCN